VRLPPVSSRNRSVSRSASTCTVPDTGTASPVPVRSSTGPSTATSTDPILPRPMISPGAAGLTGMDITFTAPLEKDGAFTTFVTVPDSAAAFGTRRPVKVAGTIDGHPFEATLMPSGHGPHWLPLRVAICTAIGKREAGEEVAVRLSRRT
jgi:hypothetical protein